MEILVSNWLEWSWLNVYWLKSSGSVISPPKICTEFQIRVATVPQYFTCLPAIDQLAMPLCCLVVHSEGTVDLSEAC